MIKKSCYILLIISCFSFSQSISINDTSYTAEDLANQLLEGSCITATNASYSAQQSVASFNNNGGSFPIPEGIILRTGIARHTEGIYTNTNLSSQLNSNSDTTLQGISDNSGQSDPVTDTAFLQFDFVTISSDFSFNFIFASNEYGQWQCGFSDVFAFLLTDLQTGVTQNLALIPATAQPISVITIRDNTYNGNCTSENAHLFDTYNPTNPATSSINMKGYTAVLNASSSLTPGNSYRIRLVIADYKNPNFDSAVFIDTGSFTTEINLGEDQTICDGNEIEMTTNLDNGEFTHTWLLNGTAITGETSNSLIATEPGTYEVLAIKNDTTCQIPGTITISELEINTPIDLNLCDNGAASYNYDLSINNEALLNLDDNTYDVIYFASLLDITNNTPIDENTISNYSSNGNNETIYIKILNILTGNYCNAQLSFNLILNAPVNVSPPSDMNICESSSTTNINLTTQDTEILNGLDPNEFTVSYYASENDLNNQNALNGSIVIPNGTDEQEIFVLITNNSSTNCFDTTSFNITINQLPLVSALENQIACSEYTLPEISDGVYYEGPNGSGNSMNAGDIIQDGGTYYIYNGPDENGCYNESSFVLTLIDEYTLDLHYCETFSVPILAPGNFYTETDGPDGTGIIIDPSEVFTSADLPLTVHYYAETIDETTAESTICRNEAFNITIYDLPLVDIPDNAPIVTCLSYTLPTINDLNTDGIPDGAYFDNNGNPLNTGDLINVSGTYWIINSEIHEFTNIDLTTDAITCTNSVPFEITIINEPNDEIACGSYTLPLLEIGNYYLEPNGQGVSISQGAVITNDTAGGLFIEGTSITFPTNVIDIYLYADDTENTPNCTNNTSFELTINSIPPVDNPTNEVTCITEGYVLPVLTHGNYFDGPGGTGNSYAANDIISNPGINTLYIYNIINGCSNEWSFEIEVKNLPLINNFTDVYSCAPYELPELSNGNYYTEPNGNGTMLFPGDIIGQETEAGTISNEVVQIYIYSEWDDLEGCDSETTFTVYLLGINLGEFEDINACDTYTLPELAVGNYYSAANGNINDLITDLTFDTAGSYTIYVYGENGIRDPNDCVAEKSFVLTISDTPVLENIDDQIVCTEFYLPALDNSSYDVNYYTENGGNSSNSIDINLPRTIPIGMDMPYTETIYVYATARNNTNCYSEQSFELTIYPKLDLDIDDTVICVDPETGSVNQADYVLLESGVNPNRYIVNWYANSTLLFTGPNYLAEQAGEYTIETSIIGNDTPPYCNYNPKTITVFSASIAVATYTITDDFENTASISINIENGYGEYQYQLDDNAFQDSNTFYQVSSGEHTVNVIDTIGNCGTIELSVLVLKYPKFFTPNGDGINDTWNINNLSNQPGASINIFDRFGKFITQIKPSGTGWNGTYNNRQLPSTDYWFSVHYKGQNDELKEFRAHFSLKR